MTSPIDTIMNLYRDLTLAQLGELNRRLREEFGDGFGITGVREPRRPILPAGSATVSTVPNMQKQNIWITDGNVSTGGTTSTTLPPFRFAA